MGGARRLGADGWGGCGDQMCVWVLYTPTPTSPIHPPPPSTAAIQRMYEQQEGQLDSPLIEGHLNLTVELIHGLTPEERFRIGSQPGGLELIKVGRGWSGWGRTSGWVEWVGQD